MRRPLTMQRTDPYPKVRYALAMLGLALGASGANCIWPWQAPVDNKPRLAALRAFDSAEELRQFLVDQANTRYNTSRNGVSWLPFGFLAAPPMASQGVMTDTSATPGENATGGGTPYSTTTIQEAGVDESDIIKNDGEYIYWLQGTKVHVVKATPPEAMSEVATITLDTSASALYLHGHQLVAVSPNWAYGIYADGGGGVANSSTTTAPPASTPGSEASQTVTAPTTSLMPVPWTGGSQTVVAVYDVSAPASPTRQATLQFEGSFADSRLIDNRLYLVTTMWPILPASPTPVALDAIPLDDWLPKYQIVSSDGQTQSGTTTPWQGFYRPEVGDGYEITTVVTVDLDNPTGEFKSTAITANAGTIYASLNGLYITDTNYDWTLNSSREDTMIHKLAFTEAGTDYVASGLVPGRPLNQYSLGEYNGYLRIATTLEAWSSQTGVSSSGVYVLGVDGTDLNVVGKVEDLGIGEQIYSVRFIGARGFVVTFKRIDPLFAIDLSDPANPTVTGQLKVSGYSDFMLPMDENHLLAIGKDAQAAGDWGAWVQGVQLSIFDVSDMANPKRVQNTVIGGRGTSSEANNNPKAFNYFPQRGALAFPIDLYTSGTMGPEWGNLEFTGLMVYSVSVADGFTELGRISTVPENPPLGGCWWTYYGSGRGVFIGDNVYAVSDLGVKSAALSAVSTPLGSVDFAGSSAQDTCYWNWIEPMIVPLGAPDLR